VEESGSGRVVELFAGVGGFRLGLQRAGWSTVWANQWEPATKTQHAFDCYRERFFAPRGEYSVDEDLRETRSVDGDVAVNEDIGLVVEQIERGERREIPDHDLLVGGFPCQDYSVAKTLNQAHGIEGKKGVLWWQIRKILERKRPRMVFLENVDRLLKSPATQRGRDFAIILSCLSDLGYLVEWRVVNAADYGFPQRRRRVFIVAHLLGKGVEPRWSGPMPWLYQDGALARGLPVEGIADPTVALLHDGAPSMTLDHAAQITQEFGWLNAVTPFLNAGVMWNRDVWTRRVHAPPVDAPATLGDILQRTEEVADSFFVTEDQRPSWEYLKGAKRQERTSSGGHTYFYSEGGVAFPDPVDRPSRTILTGEGGSTPSRFKHVVATDDGRLRRLTPVELERLNGFPGDWTATGMPDGRRAFMMGNALVIGLIEKVGKALLEMPPAVDAPGPRLKVATSA
jgi:DNA (cytosine-5)-methyltransferase 1